MQSKSWNSLKVDSQQCFSKGGMSKEILLFTIVNSKKRTCNMQFQISIGPVSQVYSVLSLDCMQSEIWFNPLRLILSVLAWAHQTSSGGGELKRGRNGQGKSAAVIWPHGPGFSPCCTVWSGRGPGLCSLFPLPPVFLSAGDNCTMCPDGGGSLRLHLYLHLPGGADHLRVMRVKAVSEVTLQDSSDFTSSMLIAAYFWATRV